MAAAQAGGLVVALRGQPRWTRPIPKASRGRAVIAAGMPQGSQFHFVVPSPGCVVSSTANSRASRRSGG